jgi:hypothetical protein
MRTSITYDNLSRAIIKVSVMVLTIDIAVVILMQLMLYFGDLDNTRFQHVLGLMSRNWAILHRPADTWISMFLFSDRAVGDPTPWWFGPIYFGAGLLQTFVLTVVICFIVIRLRSHFKKNYLE